MSALRAGVCLDGSGAVVARLAIFGLVLVLPWLNPRAGGPSASIEPWLFSAFCLALAFGAQRPAGLRAAVVAGLAALIGWACLRTGIVPETMALAFACLLVLMAAAMAAGGRERGGFLHAIALGWLVAAGLSTAMALVQYVGASDRFSPWISLSTEAYANLRQRNQFATLTVIGMASLFWLAPRGLGRWPALAAICWLALGNAATTSRTGLLQMVLLGVLALVWPGARRERAFLWSGGLVAYALAAVALPSLLEAWTGVSGNRLWERVASVDTCSSRMTLWSNVLHLIAQKPWLGWGWGELDYAHYATLYGGPRFCDILDNAHNLPLHLAVELGVPAALLACGGLLGAVVAARFWREADPARQMAWAVLAAIGVHSLVEYPLWYGPFQIAFGLCLGLLWPSRGGAWAGGWSRTVSVAGSTLALGAVLYAAWDYRRVSQIYLPPEARAAGYEEEPLAKMRGTWLFRSQARFAELTVTPLGRANAAWAYDTALELLHYSPESRVIEKLVESGTMLGRDQEVLLHLARWRAAFPDAYAEWVRAGRETTLKSK